MVNLCGQPGKHIGFKVLPCAFKDVEAQAAHWAMLHIYSNILSPDRHHKLINDWANMNDGEFNIDVFVEVLTIIAVARSIMMGEVARDQDSKIYRELWEYVCELEAVSGVLLTRTDEESARLDAGLFDSANDAISNGGA
jgi:hypothetical protein